MEDDLKYESNTHLFFHDWLHPVIRIKELVSIPFYWTDDTHFTLRHSFTVDDLRLETPGLKIFTFDPIHVFMNTSSEVHYENYKIY